jgi:hypothetical protein
MMQSDRSTLPRSSVAQIAGLTILISFAAKTLEMGWRRLEGIGRVFWNGLGGFRGVCDCVPGGHWGRVGVRMGDAVKDKLRANSNLNHCEKSERPGARSERPSVMRTTVVRRDFVTKGSWNRKIKGR